MSEKKQLTDKELENVNGGFDVGGNPDDVFCEYRDYEGGNVLVVNIGNVNDAEAEAKLWCQQNGKLYVGYRRGDRTTNTYDVKQLLDSISNNKGN